LHRGDNGDIAAVNLENLFVAFGLVVTVTAGVRVKPTNQGYRN
jgi:hypothetical protein